jgi:hypothetical protein
MRAVLMVVLLAVVLFLVSQNTDKQKKLAAYEDAQEQAVTDKKIADLKADIRKQAEEREAAEQAKNQAIAERDQALRERDDARSELTAAAAEIGRLTNTKPMTWFEKRQQESGGKLDAPPATTGTRVRTYPNYIYSQ